VRHTATFGAVLANRNFLRLWLGQIVSSIGDRFYQFALLSLVLNIHETSGVGKESARVVFCGMLPGLLFAPWLGWAVDHFSRRSLMLWSDVLRAALALSLLYFWFALNNLTLVFIVIFLMGTLNGLFIPARQAALPQLVEPAHLITANALIALIGVIANLVGVIFAGLIVSIFGARSSFLINASSFLFSGWLIYRISTPLLPRQQGESGLKKSWYELTAGWRFIRARAQLMALVFLNCLFSFTSGMFLITVLEHTVTRVDLSLGQAIAYKLTAALTGIAPKPPVFDIKVLCLGLLLACVGLGLGLGVIFCGRSRLFSRWSGLPYLGLILLGAGMIAFAQLSAYGMALAGAVLLGVFASLIAIPLEARLQHEVNDQVRGRVFALRNFGTTLSFLLALAINLNGYWLQTRGATQMIVDLGIAILALAVAASVVNRTEWTTFWELPADRS
jgi:MFS family permease